MVNHKTMKHWTLFNMFFFQISWKWILNWHCLNDKEYRCSDSHHKQQYFHILLQYYNDRRVYFAHDENNDCTTGDVVLINECPKMSKKKTFRISEIVERASKVVDQESGHIYLQENREDYVTKRQWLHVCNRMPSRFGDKNARFHKLWEDKV